MIEAGRNFRREYQVYRESSIIYPIVTDSLLAEYEDGSRDRFEVHEKSYHGLNWPSDVNFWPNYTINQDAKRVLRVWKRVQSILRTQIVDKVSDKISQYMKIVS